MASNISRASKRLRLAQQPTAGWMCNSCRRSFASSSRSAFASSTRSLQTPEQQRKEAEKTTHFGYETVAESLKASKVATVFSSVASSYDTMNDLMSLGIHRLWKDHFVRGLNPGIHPNTLPRDPSQPRPQQRILDIAGGTGDIAMRMLDHASTLNRDTTAHVTVSDINPEMLAEGRKRLSATPYAAAGRIDFLEANAESLPSIPDASIDLYTVAFGIRNFTHKDAALREAFRVLKPGGVFACLEFAPNLNNPLFNAVYKRWSFSAIPLIGQVVAADRDSYQYLVESIERFPKQEDFAQMIREAGFIVPGQGREGAPSEGVGKDGWEDLSFGIAAIHKGVKPL